MHNRPDFTKNPAKLEWVEGVPVRRPSHIAGTGTIDDPFVFVGKDPLPGSLASFTGLTVAVAREPRCFRSRDGALVFFFPGEPDRVVTLRMQEEIDAFREELERILETQEPATIPFIGTRNTGTQHPEDPPPPQASSPHHRAKQAGA